MWRWREGGEEEEEEEEEEERWREKKAERLAVEERGEERKGEKGGEERGVEEREEEEGWRVSGDFLLTIMSSGGWEGGWEEVRAAGDEGGGMCVEVVMTSGWRRSTRWRAMDQAV